METSVAPAMPCKIIKNIKNCGTGASNEIKSTLADTWWKNGWEKKGGPSEVPPETAQKIDFWHKCLIRKSWGNWGKKKQDFEHPRKKEEKKWKKQWKKMTEKSKKNARTCRNMQEHARTWKNVRGSERKWKKVKVHERKWKKIECLSRMFIVPLGIRRAPRSARLFPWVRSNTFSECSLFPCESGERPREHPRATREGTARGPARDLNLEKRDKHLQNRDEERTEKIEDKKRREKRLDRGH